MSLYGIETHICGVPCAMVLRGSANGQYQAVFERERASRALETVSTAAQREEKVPAWRQRDFSDVPVGTPYRWQGQVYKLWQQHNATGQNDWSSDKAVSNLDTEEEA